MTSGKRRRPRPRGGKGGAEPHTVIRERERRVVELSEQGCSQITIASQLNVSQAAVSKILRRVDERAVREIDARIAHLKARLQRHLEYLSQEGRRSWEKSKDGRVRRRQHKAVRPDGSPAVTQDVVIDEHPDPRLLDQARKAEEALAELLGFGVRAVGRSTRDAPAANPPIMSKLSTTLLEQALAELTHARRDTEDGSE